MADFPKERTGPSRNGKKENPKFIVSVGRDEMGGYETIARAKEKYRKLKSEGKEAEIYERHGRASAYSYHRVKMHNPDVVELYQGERQRFSIMNGKVHIWTGKSWQPLAWDPESVRSSMRRIK